MAVADPLPKPVPGPNPPPAPLSLWQQLGAKNQALIEAGAVLVVGGAGDVIVNQLNSGVFDGQAILRALEIGGGLGLAYVVAYLRGHVQGLLTPTP